MVFFYLIGALCIASSVAKAYFDTKKAVKPEFIAKLLASVSFMFCAVYAIYNNPDAVEYGIFILCALIFGTIGDILLCLDGFFPDNENYYKFFNTAGTATFFIGHVMYMALLFVYAPISRTPFLLLALPVLPLIMLALILTGQITLPKIKSYLMVVYFLVAGGVIIGAVSFVINAHSSPVGWIVLAASILFAFSDCFLGLFHYCPALKISEKVAPYVVMPTYCIAQVLYALSIYYIAA